MDERGDRQMSAFFAGLARRSQLIECPLKAYVVKVLECNGDGDCVTACMVNVFAKDSDGKCVVVNDELCFGCMACVAQCLQNGVTVEPRDARKYPSVDEILR
jgi:NAD-dependent dihydropyrimidine dehydrogenase PreA subunit